MIAYMFPGQGSQKKGMGKALFEAYPNYINTANEILEYDIAYLCQENPCAALKMTEYTQPALYVVGVLHYLQLQEAGKEPDYLLGHSLGEYCALFASGVVTYEDGLRLVHKRGELMAKVTEGGLAAVVGLSLKDVEEVLVVNGITDMDIANYNSAKQIIIAGPNDTIRRIQPIFEQSGAKLFMPLNVSGAFHSRYMQKASQQFDTFLQNFSFTQGQIPIIANATAKPYNFETTCSLLVRQMYQPVRWYESVSHLLQLGVTDFQEMQPGGVLNKMIPHIIANPLTTDSTPIRETVAKQKPQDRGTTIRDTENEAMVVPVQLQAQSLGSQSFMHRYKLKYAYAAGAMYRGIASPALVTHMARHQLLSFLGTGGLSLQEIEACIRQVQQDLPAGASFGVNLLHSPYKPEREMQQVKLLLSLGINLVEASAYMGLTEAIVYYRVQGLYEEAGVVKARNRIMAKLSRPEVAFYFLEPAPTNLLKALQIKGFITADQARLAACIPIADDLCVEADSGGHTDQGMPYAVFPVIRKMCDEAMQKHCYTEVIHVGAAGGIGTPEAAAASFSMGADFVLTGSVNQCTVEAGTSDAVKDLLQQMNVQDSDYAPAGDLFEVGAKIQVLKKGLFFSVRANKLYDLYKTIGNLKSLDTSLQKQIEERYFKKSFDQIFEELKQRKSPEEIDKAEKNPKVKMAMVFKWYFHHTTIWAITGDTDFRTDYQIHCSPALGAFNQLVKGTALQDWRQRHPGNIADFIMQGAAERLNQFYQAAIQTAAVSAVSAKTQTKPVPAAM